MHMSDINDPWGDGNRCLRRSLVITNLLDTVPEQGLKAATVADLGDQTWILG